MAGKMVYDNKLNRNLDGVTSTMSEAGHLSVHPFTDLLIIFFILLEVKLCVNLVKTLIQRSKKQDGRRDANDAHHDSSLHGGEWVARVLKARGVQFVFTLTGGHISPILVACKQIGGIRVIDVRHEVNAVFAADAVARLSGIPGIAVVTAGPGVTNTLTAIKNAQMAQSPIILLGGAAATVVQGRGALQDINQLSLFKSVTKWSTSVRRVRDIVPTLEHAFVESKSGVPGPVFVELPIDVLYPYDTVKSFYKGPSGDSLTAKLIHYYLQWHLGRLFAGADEQQVVSGNIQNTPPPSFNKRLVQRVAQKLLKAKRPLFLIGAQTVLDVDNVTALATAIEHISVPVYLSSMARGLLGKNHALQMRHQRRNALKESDFVLLAGVPCDFRIEYGNHIKRGSFYVSANLSKTDLYRNRRPDIGVLGDPGLFLRELAKYIPKEESLTKWHDWKVVLTERNQARQDEIVKLSQKSIGKINPLLLCREMEKLGDSDMILVADGGDFVGTASYIVRPPGPLTWLDPGPFGTLGVGAGFALGAKLVCPNANVWIVYGDGSVGYSLAEFDTFVRHNIPIIAVVGNDAGWTQIARSQMELFKDPVATQLLETDYHVAATGFGGAGYKVSDPKLVSETLENAKKEAASGRPVLVNALIDKTDFRSNSVSV